MMVVPERDEGCAPARVIAPAGPLSPRSSSSATTIRYISCYNSSNTVLGSLNTITMSGKTYLVAVVRPIAQHDDKEEASVRVLSIHSSQSYCRSSTLPLPTSQTAILVKNFYFTLWTRWAYCSTPSLPPNVLNPTSKAAWQAIVLSLCSIGWNDS